MFWCLKNNSLSPKIELVSLSVRTILPISSKLPCGDDVAMTLNSWLPTLSSSRFFRHCAKSSQGHSVWSELINLNSKGNLPVAPGLSDDRSERPTMSGQYDACQNLAAIS